MIIRTILGDIAPDTLGLTLGHEHIFARPPAEHADADLQLDDETKSVAELDLFRAAGGSAVVEMTTIDYGRDAGVLARAARASGIHVIAATGFNKAKFAHRFSEKMTTAEIAAWMIAEVRDGIDGGGRAGLIKASSSLDRPTDHETRVFEAAAEAHAATGAPLSTHTEKGTWADGQIDLLTKLGVPASSILIGHLDLKPDIGYLRDVAARGSYLGFDQFSKAKYLPDATRIDLIAKLIADGHGERIVISGDLARRSYLQAWGGGPGYAFFLTGLQDAFAAAGISIPHYRSMLRDNPRRLLAFQPRG